MNIIVTGGSQGIGLAIARTFAQQGTRNSIAICARNEEVLRSAEQELRTISSRNEILAKKCDVSAEEDVKAFVSEVETKFGTVDLLVNNAGFGIFKAVQYLATSEFQDVLATNLRGVFLMTRAALPSMRQKKSGSIVTICSLAGKKGFRNGGAYCASKFAVRGLMQCLFLEVRSDNIRFLTIYPGSVDTHFFAADSHSSITKSKNALEAQDIAHCVEAALLLPPNADVSEIEIRPTNPSGS